MITGIHQRCDAEMHRRHAACGADRADAVLQRRQPFLEHGGRGIGDAGIDVAGAFEVEQRSRVVGVLKDIGRRLVDRHRARAGDGIGVLACMQAQGLEGGWFGCWHVGLVNGREKVAAGFATIRGERQPPFTAPAVSPATIWRCANTVSSSTGKVTISAAAARGPQLS